jgi:glycosyltransferase involved in cell wall biosynthesis
MAEEIADNPLVTISIPTFNSGQYLDLCLQGVEQQTYKYIEVNIVDGGSSDETIAIAKQHDVKDLITCRMALLKARHEGLLKANGEYILLLDCDQILEQTTVERAVKKMAGEGLKMLVLEEGVYQVNNWLEKLFQQDRRLVHYIKDLNPYSGVMLPRFYKTSTLKDAFSNIPIDALERVGGQDHAIIYFEAWQQTKEIDVLPDAVQHIEPNSLKLIIKKFYRWGYTSKAAHHPRYRELLASKERFRKGLFSKGTVKASFASIALLLIKGVPYAAGKLRSKWIAG